MKIAVINGTEVRGCTYSMKEAFLDAVGRENEIKEFYLPKDMSHFCCGCKTCFFKSEQLCPHAKQTVPVWEALVEADLLVWATPVYAMRVPGQVKALLDHYAVHWMVHRPDDKMFTKRAVILTNSIGAPNGGTQKDIETSLMWWGISDIKKLGVGLMEGVIWEELSDKRKTIITDKIKKLARRYKAMKPARKGIKVSVLFKVTKKMHQDFAKKENPLSSDNQYWLDKGWIKI